MSNEIQKWYAHIDLDAFFASVEQLDHPEYKGKPVIVGGKPEDRRGVVSTASYEARKFGVHSAMPTYQAYKLCPQGIYVHGNYKRYSELSYQIMTIFKDYSPEVDQMSIDEAFINLTGTEKLFGPPEETCMAIKARIKQETGLTVSIGLASTKYVAKICSGYKKPDGFYKVEPGQETDFMLSLPLEKVWGVGEKTLINLHQKGIFTTRDIYEKDIQTLSFLFGPNTAGFLYDVVRGGKNEMFRKETKTHSISAERTFPFDLTDTYTLETEILELSQDVMFRLLKEKGYSRTAFMKLRYEDFTTVTIQRTLDQNIKTIDSFYEILTSLFNEKREKNRGIRLLGVGFENVENTERPEQQSLFDDNTKKKQQVEKAILQLNQKHPEIKVQKARTLKLAIAFAFLFTGLFGINKTPLWAENQTTIIGAGTILSDDLTSPESEKNDFKLFDLDSTDTSKFEYDVSGYWNIDFTSKLISTFGNRTPFAFSFTPPIFKQEIELSTWILLNNQWYFDASFADGFEKNTFSAGYKNGQYLNAAQLSNRNIGMTNDYSASYFGYGLKGGKNQAPGLAIQFADIRNNKWKGDLMLRYDMTNSKKAVFYGMNNVTDTNINLNTYLFGKKFVLPEAASASLGKIKAIYVENSKGEYRDENQKRYIKLSSSKYSVFENLSQINFTKDANTGKQGNSIPTILVTFTEDSEVTTIITKTGSYKDSSSFAGKIQALFNEHSDLDLSKFSYNLENKIENSKALVLQNSSGLSPYLCANIYDCGNNLSADVSVISATTEQESTLLTAIQIDENDSLFADYFSENKLYAQLITINQQDSSLQNPVNRFPLATVNPNIYLNLTNNEDLVIRVRNYSPVNSLQIGTKAVEGTVYVYKNGIIDSGAKYDSNTGEVTLSSSINDTDKIVIFYQEDSEDFSGGSLAAGLGFVYTFTPELIWDFSVTSRFPLSINEKYSTVNSQLNGFTALTNGISYNKNNFSIEDKLAVSIQNPDQTGNLLVNSNDLYINETYYLSSSSGYTTKTTPFINQAYLNEELNCSVSNNNGIQDNYISGYAIPLYWDFTSLQNLDNTWASVDIKLDNGNLLANSSCLEIALKPQFQDITDSSNYDLYLQLGISAATDFYGEDVNSVKTWNISTANNKTLEPLDLTKAEWQTVKINLDDYDRAFLTSNYDARLILVKKSADSLNLKGRILAGPYEPYVQSIFVTTDSNISTQTYTELTGASPSSKELNITKNYSSKISWKVDSSFEEISDTHLTAISNFTAADFSNYKTINLDFAIEAETFENVINNEDSVFTVILDRESLNAETEGKLALKVELYNLLNYITPTLTYHTLTIETQTGKVFIDNAQLNQEEYKVLALNKAVQPSRQKIVLNLNQNGQLYNKGNLYINNLYYSDTEAYALLQNNFHVNYSKPGNIAAIKDFVLLKDGSFTIDSTQNVSTLSEFNIDSTVEGGITALNLKLNTDATSLYSKADNKVLLTQAGHSIQTADPLFNIISLNENYRYNNADESLSKSDSVEFNFNKAGLKFIGKTDATESLNNRNQNILLEETFTHKFKKNTFNFDSNIKTNQKINTKLAEYNSFNTDNYFAGWKDISTLQFSMGDELASNRNVEYKISSGINFTEKKYTPKIEYILNSNYVNSSESKYLLNQTLLWKNPFTIKKQTISLNYSKKASDSKLSLTAGNYLEDSKQLFQNYGENPYFFKAIPFVELFSKNLPHNLISNDENTLYSSYGSNYEIEWKRPLLNSVKDLYIPLSSKFILERDTKLSDSLSDIYQIKFTVNNTAVNNFGTKAAKPVFTWFEADELISNLTATVKLPADNISTSVYNLSWYGQFLIYINEKTTLNTAVDFQIDTGNTWSSKATAIYSRPGTTSLLVDAANYVFPSTSKIKFVIIQKETLNIQLGKNSTQLFSQFDYLHTTSMKFLQNYSVDLGIGSTFTWNQLTASSMALNLSISGRMKF